MSGVALEFYSLQREWGGDDASACHTGLDGHGATERAADVRFPARFPRVTPSKMPKNIRVNAADCSLSLSSGSFLVISVYFRHCLNCYVCAYEFSVSPSPTCFP